ncbi:hypothetical protein [Sporosarcina sp. P19]|nr:hypothetical protein [Sporosarcina sp. P19]
MLWNARSIIDRMVSGKMVVTRNLLMFAQTGKSLVNARVKLLELW